MAALIPAIPAITAAGIFGVGGLINLFRKTRRNGKQEEFAEKVKLYLEQAGSNSDDKTVLNISKVLELLAKQTISLQDEICCTLTNRSLTFSVENKTKNRRIKLYKHPTLHGYYIPHDEDLKEIPPGKSGEFEFQKRRGFFGCSGVLLLSVHGGKIEYEVAIAFRNSMVQIQRKAGCKFAVTFTNRKAYEKTNGEKLYRKMMLGKREKFAKEKLQFCRCLAADGPHEISNEEDEEKITVLIHMSCKDEADCSVQFIQPEAV